MMNTSFFRFFLSFFLIQLLSILICTSVGAQSMGLSNVAITPDPSSILELRTTSKGLLVPRMTSAQRDAIASPANGLLIFNTDLQKINFYDASATAWRVLFSGTPNINSITGTNNRILLTGTATDPIVDISPNYVGQASITTLGTVTTGTWNASTIPIANGGTGSVTAPTPGGVIFATSALKYGSTGAGSFGQILMSSGAGTPTWSGAVYPSSSNNQGAIITSDGTNFNSGVLTNFTNKLASDVLLSNNPITYIDGPNVTLAPGTWYVNGDVTFTGNTANSLLGVTAKLWDGTVVFASGEKYIPRGGVGIFTSNSISLSGIITLLVSTKIKISAADITGSGRTLMKSATKDNPSGNNASYINAFRIGN